MAIRAGVAFGSFEGQGTPASFIRRRKGNQSSPFEKRQPKPRGPDNLQRDDYMPFAEMNGAPSVSPKACSRRNRGNASSGPDLMTTGRAARIHHHQDRKFQKQKNRIEYRISQKKEFQKTRNRSCRR